MDKIRHSLARKASGIMVYSYVACMNVCLTGNYVSEKQLLSPIT